MAADFEIWGVPVTVKIRDGEVVARLDGYHPEEEFRRLLEA